jgi:hypothetical protein
MMHEVGNENVENFNLIANKFSKRTRATAVMIFIGGTIASALLAILNFTAGFMVFASTTGFFGGLLLSEALFYRSMEAKA